MSARRSAAAAWRHAAAIAVAVAACHRESETPRREPPPVAPTAATAPSAAAGDPIRRAPSWLDADVTACVPAPPLRRLPGCSIVADAGAPPPGCADYAPTSSPDVGVLHLRIEPSPSDFARTLGIPSMKGVVALPSGAPDFYREFEGPHLRPTPDGRQVRLEARSLMLGGVVHWATLGDPRFGHDVVVVRMVPLSDAPLDVADRRAVVAWDLPAIATCLDAAIARTGASPR